VTDFTHEPGKMQPVMRAAHDVMKRLAEAREKLSALEAAQAGDGEAAAFRWLVEWQQSGPRAFGCNGAGWWANDHAPAGIERDGHTNPHALATKLGMPPGAAGE
jgi:hypothetical protein